MITVNKLSNKADLKLLNEAVLLEGLRTREPRIVNAFHQRVKRFTFSFVTKRKGSIDTAMDILQEAFYEFYKKIDQMYLQNDTKVSSFFMGFVKMVWLRHNERIIKNKETSTHDWQLLDRNPLAENILEKKEQRQLTKNILAECIQQLPKDGQELLKNYYYGKQPLNDIEKEMGYVAGYGKVKISRCREKLRSFIAEHPLRKELRYY